MSPLLAGEQTFAFGSASLTADLRSESERSGVVGAHGLDTVAYVFRGVSPGLVEQLRHRSHRVEKGGSAWVFERGRSEADVRLLAGRVSNRPGASDDVVRVECRADALLAGNRDFWGLRHPSEAVRGAVAASGEVRRVLGAGVSPDWLAGALGTAEVARADLACELEFPESSEGLAFLATVAAMRPPRRKSDVWSADDGRAETIYFRTPKRGVVLERIYDKGVESGSHPAGQRVRIETQHRPAKSARVTPAAFARADHGRVFGESVRHYAKRETVAVGADQATAQLVGAVNREELTLAKARGLLGDLTLFAAFGRAVYADSTGRRRLAELRKHGICPEAVLPPGRTVPVGRLLAEAIEAWSA